MDTSKASSASVILGANPLFAGPGHDDWRPLPWSRAAHSSSSGGVVGALDLAAGPTLSWQRGKWARSPYHPGSWIDR